MLTGCFNRALSYASEAHATQTRKGTSIPYVSHLLAVASIVLENGGDEDEAIAALLHDAPEDQGGEPRLADIRKHFGDEVARIVEACSDSLVEDPTAKTKWRDRKDRYHRRLREHRDDSIYLVSAADKLHNVRTMIVDERREGARFWSRFHAGKEEQLWNLRQLIDIYGSLEGGRSAAVTDALRQAVDELARADGTAATQPGRFATGPEELEPYEEDIAWAIRTGKIKAERIV